MPLNRHARRSDFFLKELAAHRRDCDQGVIRKGPDVQRVGCQVCAIGRAAARRQSTAQDIVPELLGLHVPSMFGSRTSEPSPGASRFHINRLLSGSPTAGNRCCKILVSHNRIALSPNEWARRVSLDTFPLDPNPTLRTARRGFRDRGGQHFGSPAPEDVVFFQHVGANPIPPIYATNKKLLPAAVGYERHTGLPAERNDGDKACQRFAEAACVVRWRLKSMDRSIAS